MAAYGDGPADSYGVAAGQAQPGTLLQDTVDQFEKVINLERTLLRKSILKLERDLEEASTELGMKEEELIVWEEKLQQVQQDNETKLKLARQRLYSSKMRPGGGPQDRRSPSAAVRGPSPLGFIAEGDEESEEEDVDGGEASQGFSASVEPIPTGTEAINALACRANSEIAKVRERWLQLEKRAAEAPPKISAAGVASALPASTISASPPASSLGQGAAGRTDHLAQCHQHLDEWRAKLRRMKEENAAGGSGRLPPAALAAQGARGDRPVAGARSLGGTPTGSLGNNSIPATTPFSSLGTSLNVSGASASASLGGTTPPPNLVHPSGDPLPDGSGKAAGAPLPHAKPQSPVPPSVPARTSAAGYPVQAGGAPGQSALGARMVTGTVPGHRQVPLSGYQPILARRQSPP